MALVGAAVVGITSLSIAKANSIAISSLGSNKVALQAQQYASSKGELIRTTKYSDLTAQNKSDIGNTGFQDEVVVGTETAYDSFTMKKDVTIRVYKTGESVPRSSLVVTRYSKSMDVSSVPSGSIIPWYGNLADIPDGYAVCDGANGTPDLRNRFIVGAGSYYGLNDIGGANTVNISNANLPSDGLNAFGYSCVGHYCSWGQGNFGVREGEYIARDSLDGSNGWQDYYYFTAFSSLLSNNWKGEPLENRPPYFALYYIMKV